MVQAAQSRRVDQCAPNRPLCDPLGCLFGHLISALLDVTHHQGWVSPWFGGGGRPGNHPADHNEAVLESGLWGESLNDGQ